MTSEGHRRPREGPGATWRASQGPPDLSKPGPKNVVLVVRLKSVSSQPGWAGCRESMGPSIFLTFRPPRPSSTDGGSTSVALGWPTYTTGLPSSSFGLVVFALPLRIAACWSGRGRFMRAFAPGVTMATPSLPCTASWTDRPAQVPLWFVSSPGDPGRPQQAFSCPGPRRFRK